MIIQNFSKDSKRGFAIGSNRLTPEKFAAGAVALASVLVVSAAQGLLGAVSNGVRRTKSRPGKGKATSKKKKALPLLAAPIVFKAAKAAMGRKSLGAIVSKFTTAKEPVIDSDIEVINSIPISSEE